MVLNGRFKKQSISNLGGTTPTTNFSSTTHFRSSQTISTELIVRNHHITESTHNIQHSTKYTTRDHPAVVFLPEYYPSFSFSLLPSPLLQQNHNKTKTKTKTKGFASKHTTDDVFFGSVSPPFHRSNPGKSGKTQKLSSSSSRIDCRPILNYL